jgi:hypothetical protein
MDSAIGLSGRNGVSPRLEPKQEVPLPSRIHSHGEFADAILRVSYSPSQTGDNRAHFAPLLKRAYYLLGWLAGDAVKQFASRGPKARIGIALCKKHPENFPLGEYVSGCIKTLGIRTGRIADQSPSEREPHGAYRWLSSYSLVISWMKTGCLGLAREELTSYTAVRMDWLLSAPNEFRLWFLRGLADSDGTVNVRNKAVFIITSPNTDLVRKLLDSVGCHNTCGVSKGVGVVAISGYDAARIQIFNPEVATHRSKLLEKITNAATYQRHWPEWLEARVECLMRQGLDAKTTRDALLNEDQVYVKLKTLKQKMNLCQK